MRRFTLAATLLFSLCFALSAFAAAPLRVFVSDMNVVGVQNRDELKATLQTLLASRLNGDTITAVASSAEADAILTGTYVVIGKVFSVDAMAKSANGRTLTRAFVQGESQDELIPAMGKLADKHRPPRKARNIHTGEPATVPDRNVVLFRASEPLVEAAQKAPKQ